MNTYTVLIYCAPPYACPRARLKGAHHVATATTDCHVGVPLNRAQGRAADQRPIRITISIVIYYFYFGCLLVFKVTTITLNYHYLVLPIKIIITYDYLINMYK